MEYLISVLLSGIAVGGQYALIAIGYTMVYGILRLYKLCPRRCFHGRGPDGHLLCRNNAAVRRPPPLVIIMTVVLGFVIERLAYKPLRTAPRMSVMISAIGVSYFLQNTATYITGGQPMTYPTISWLCKDRRYRRYAHEARRAHHAVHRCAARVFALTQLINHQDRYGYARRVQRL